ncbi:GNAT family N-acetyltransferase [Piscinibacter sp. HJYY11]|uniref:GNAT family N-acetyltransferase n=1 Tax=Piscinibacter sp. HJYY11 TaxID=2801333 RepID=UPI00191E0C36|nr:GNAT family N-acetyltransferase [Piscinibacter sp. HJYY11]MBL0727281.1 GNAT family N-acetyltransferase [Piscinibacter sp. HJYY11]
MQIRPFCTGDEPALLAVFRSAVHGLASRSYTREQLNAWAPQTIDQSLWTNRMQGIQPFIVEVSGQIVAYADVQTSGYIDHFFVSAEHAGQGIGSFLMEHLIKVANGRATPWLASDVSLTAQPFFGKFGFAIVEQRFPVLRGIVVPNALMRKQLTADPCIDGARAVQF